MYSRRYGERELHFEASGGLVNSALVLQDRETDSYWSIMEGRATAGPLRGTRLELLPGSRKVRFGDWLARNPQGRVLSVGGREHTRDVYADYRRARRGFRGARARDARLPSKAPIFAFERADRRYAVAHARAEGGRSFELADGGFVFVHRPSRAALFQSTRAFVSRADTILLGAGARGVLSPGSPTR